jgi:ubiquinone/menaquinone biosynthesis C-methylase UbiE
MPDRGQRSFVRLPRLAAMLYQSLTHLRAIDQQHRDIARDLASRIEWGKLLDIGTGPGRLLLELHRLRPEIKLYGMDISEAMLRLAAKNLRGVNVDLRRGDIRNTDYADDFFDGVTCTGSFYLWDEPEDCLKEIFRILRPGCSAYLFETYRDCDEEQVEAAVRANLANEGIIRRLIAPPFLMKQLRMAYSVSEVSEIIGRTSFEGSHSREKVVLGGLPAWSRITLTKCS